MVIKSVGVWSVARMYGAISAIMGLLFGVVFALASTIGFTMAEPDRPAFVGMMFGAGAVIALPIIYGVMGLIGGAIGALIYNAIAGLVGGVVIQTE